LIGQQWMEPRGLGVGFVWPDEKDIPPSERSQTEEVFLKSGEDFQPCLLINTPERKTVIISVLLDYQQIEFTLNGKPGTLHQVIVQPGGDLEIPMQVAIPQDGQHDLMVVAFTYPETHDLNPVTRSEMGITTIGRRTVIYTGDRSVPSADLPPAITGYAVPDDVSLNMGVSFARLQNAADQKSHPITRQLYVGSGTINQRYSYQVWVSNLFNQENAEIVLLQFQNYHQISIQDKLFAYVLLEPNQEVYFDESVQLSASEGVDIIQIIYIQDPYQSILKKEVQAPYVFSSPSLAIEVVAE
jgi:hypothetical protein